MLRRLSRGELIDPVFTLFSVPTGRRYDVLRGLDYLRAAGVPSDSRVVVVIDLVRSIRDSRGLFPLSTPTELDIATAGVASPLGIVDPAYERRAVVEEGCEHE